MGIQITGSNDTIQAVDGNLSIEGVSLNFNHENVTGISTMATGHITGTATIDDDLKVGISTLFVDVSTGRVGINTISPQSVLQVNDNNPVIAQIWRKNGGTDDQARIALGALSTNVPTQRGIQLIAENNGAGHDFIVNTSNSHALGPTEKLRVTSAGLVGINSTTPNKQLTVQGLDVALRLKSTVGTGRIGMEFYDTAAQKGFLGYPSSGNDNMSLQQNEAADFYCYVNGADRLRIRADGRVAIASSLAVTGVCTASSFQVAGDIAHTGDDDTKITFTDNQIDFTTGGSSRIYANNYALYVRSGFPFAFLASSGDSPHIKSGGTNAQDLLFTTGSSNPTRLQITSGGNILCGGTGVSQTNRSLVVGSDAEANLAIETHNTSASETANIRFYRSRGTAASPTTLVDNDVISNLIFYGHDGTDYAHSAAMIRVECDGTVAGNQMPGAMTFHTNSGTTSASESVRIDSEGRMIIARSGTAGDLNSHDATLHVTAPTDGGQGGIYVHCNSQSAGTAEPHYGIKIDALNCANNASLQAGLLIDVDQQYTASETGIQNDVYGSYNTTKCYDAILRKQVGAFTNGYSYFSNIIETSSGGSTYHFYGQDDGTLKVRIERDGDVQNANNSYGSTSDVKLKENIVDAGSQWADIKAVKVRNFNFISDPNNTKMIGVVAQEIETVSAGLVKTDNDITVDEATGEGTVTGTTKSVKYSILYMKAIKALQEAMTRIETLETKVTALEG